MRRSLVKQFGKGVLKEIYDELDEFVMSGLGETQDKIYKRFKHMLFLVVYPDKLKWDLNRETNSNHNIYGIRWCH